MEFHPAANIFPLEDETLDALAADIKEHNLQCPIEICDGKIIDGRRRFMACRIAEVEPEYVNVSPEDPISYVWSLNFHRRNLSLEQASMAGARRKTLYAAEAKKRQGTRTDLKEQTSGPVVPEVKRARDDAGKSVGVSGKSVDFATTVLEKGSKCQPRRSQTRRSQPRRSQTC